MKHILKQSGLLLLELLLTLFFVLVLMGLFFGLIYPILSSQMAGDHEVGVLSEDPFELLVLTYLPMCVIVVGVTWAIHRLLFKRNQQELGFNLRGMAGQLGIGMLWGSVLVFVGFLLLLVTGQIGIMGTDPNVYLLVGFLIMFIFQSFSEEVIFRSYLIPTIEHRLGTWSALIISSILFALLHVGNAGISWIGAANLIFGGVLMGLLFIRYRTIWAPTGMHFAWNYVQSTVLGFEVSGFKTYSFWSLQDKGADIWTGGDFGYEGSLIAVIFLMVACYFFWRDSPQLRQEFNAISVNEVFHVETPVDDLP